MLCNIFCIWTRIKKVSVIQLRRLDNKFDTVLKLYCERDRSGSLSLICYTQSAVKVRGLGKGGGGSAACSHLSPLQ